MKLLAATLVSLSMAVPAFAQTDLTIARSGSQPSRPAPGENFTGSVRIDPLFEAREPSRTSGAMLIGTLRVVLRRPCTFAVR